MNFVSFFCSVSGFSPSLLGTSFEIVGLTSFLGFGCNGLFGVDGGVICFCSGGLFLKSFSSFERIESWDLTKVWLGFKGEFKFADWWICYLFFYR